MSASVGQDIFERVEALVRAEGLRRTEAIRQVAKELSRTAAATSSAYYNTARRVARVEPDPEPTHTPGGHMPLPALAPRPQDAERSSRHGDAASLYAEMLPLVEAGGSIEQAARRFAREDDVHVIAAGFRRWLAREQPAIAGQTDPATRVVILEAEVRGLRRELARCERALDRVRTALDDLER